MVSALVFMAAGLHPSTGDPPPSISVSGGLPAPLIFTWKSSLPVQGSNWSPGEAVSISLNGPLNTPGVPGTAVPLGSATAGNDGTFSASLAIPYDQGVTGAQARIPRPGLYQVQATGSASGATTAANTINLAPATDVGTGSTGIDWSHERGTRPGVLPGPLSTYSPERSDPNWITVWDNRPVQIYGVAAGTQAGGANQPSRISYEDDPITHYAHDVNVYLEPDPQYRWTVGTANYDSAGEDEAGVALGRIEIEWESLNNGSPDTYDTGQIGLPDWAVPTTGDRIYVLGRWVLDAGHPEVGDRTELHPPRLLAVMRQRPGISSAAGTASQVDIYVSGHGGAANRYPSGMDALLSQGGYGGGRIRDVLNAADQDTYYRAGPLPLIEVPIIDLLVSELSGGSVSGPIFATAGPSAFSWGTPAPEQQPVNDMDYDFDVPLPAAPNGAASLNVEVTTHAQHTTTVTEAVSYPAMANGKPAVAHIHLPYNGADNGIYARTLKFSWNTAPAPNHFRVSIDHLTVNALPGKWQVWSEVGGQWTYLPKLAPGLMQTTQGSSVAIPNAQFDLYLNGSDTVRVLVQGYRARCLDTLFGTLFNMASYEAGIHLLETCGPVNNDDLGGALLELPALPSSAGSYTVNADADGQTGGGAFQASITIQDVNPTPPSAECQGRGSLTPAIASGGVVGAGLSVPAVTRLSPDGLISIFGQNFAPAGTARGLAGADVQSGSLPTNLGCTCVAVNHRLAPLLYVSPTLINVQAPIVPGEASAAVQVIANCGTTAETASSAQTVSAQAVAPEFFFFQQNSSGANPVAATDAVNGALIGAAGLLPGGVFTPAKPGEYVALYMTGLGQLDPPLAPAVLALLASPSAWPVSVSLNGVQLAASDVLYGGAAPGFAGLYQVNIHVPTNAPDGNLPVSVAIGGVTTPAGAFLTVHK